MLLEFIEYAVHQAAHTRPLVWPLAWCTTSHADHHDLHRIERGHNYTSTAFALAVLQQAGALALFGAAVCASLRWGYSEWCTYAAWSVLVYNSAHFVSHTDWAPTMRAYHRAHHRNRRTNIGISSPLVDWVCGTMHASFVVSQPLLLLLPAPLSFWAVELK